MHQTAVASCSRALNNLAAILEKARAHAEAKKIDSQAFLDARLYPDMFPLKRQVQLASDSAKGGLARLAQGQPPSFEDNEATFEQLIERCNKTVAYLETLKPGQFDGGEDRTVSWQSRSATRTMQGQAYLLHHVLPNVYFHATTAYAILRHSGVEVGKQDFLGKL